MALNTPTDLGSNTGTGASATVVRTLAAAVPLGQRVIVSYSSNALSTDAQPTCADSRGNTYVVDDEQIDPTPGGDLRVLVFSAPVTTALQIGDTITVTAASNTRRAIHAAYCNVEAKERTAKAGATSTSPSSGVTGARTAASSLLWGAMGGRSGTTGITFTAGTGFTGIGGGMIESVAGASSRYLAAEYQLMSVAAGTDPATGTLSVSIPWEMIAVVYPAQAAASRQYLSGAFLAGLTPSIDTAWTRAVSGIGSPRRSLNHKTAAEFASYSVGGLFGGTTTADVAMGQWITAPLDADQTITGTLSLVFLTQEVGATENAHLAVSLRVIKPDGTDRGILVRSMATSTEFSTTLETRKLGPLTLSSVAALTGDRLLLEIGVHGVTPANAANILITHSARNDLSDYALTDGLAAGSVGWWEVSTEVTFVEDQILKPTADVTDGTWLNESGNNTNLFASIDDGETVNDADYIQSAVAPAADTVEVQLASGVPPDTGEAALVIRTLTV